MIYLMMFNATNHILPSVKDPSVTRGSVLPDGEDVQAQATALALGLATWERTPAKPKVKAPSAWVLIKVYPADNKHS